MADCHHSGYNQSTLLLTSNSDPMSYYPARPGSTHIARDLPTDDDDDAHKRALLINVIEHWKWITSEHQHRGNEHSSDTFTYQPSLPATQSSNNEGTYEPSNERQANTTDKSHRRNGFSNKDDDNEKSIMSMKKRDRPLPTSAMRRREMLKSPSALSESSDTKLLTPHQRNRVNLGTGRSKKSHKAGPIFIAPKKASSPSYPSSVHHFDDCLQTGQKPILKRHGSFNSVDNTAPPSSSSSRFPVTSIPASQRSSSDDDSDDENDHRSLLIRDKRIRKAPSIGKSDSQPHPSLPSTILITDPSGLSHVFDPDFDAWETNDVTPIPAEGAHSLDTNTLGPNSIFNYESALPDMIIIPPTPPVIRDKHKLHSIGEELEDEEEEEAEEKPKGSHDTLFSRELDRVETKPRPRQATLNVQPPVQNHNSTENNQESLPRRWSDTTSDQEPAVNSPSPSKPLKKSLTAPVVLKPSAPSTVKVSLGKFLLMKLHLSKDDLTDPSLSPELPRKRTVRRSPNKKRYQTQ